MMWQDWGKEEAGVGRDPHCSTVPRELLSSQREVRNYSSSLLPESSPWEHGLCVSKVAAPEGSS